MRSSDRRYQLNTSLGLSLLLLASISTTLVNAVATRPTRRETVEEAALHARTLLEKRSDGLGTLMSVFPSDYYDESLQDLPIGGMEYFAATEQGDIIVLAMPISKQIRNVINSERHNVTFAVKDEVAYRMVGAKGATDRNRVTLFGYMEELTDKEDIKDAARRFGRVHKDAKAYFPPNGVHEAYWAVIRVERLYWIGGFGDTHYIGWIPLDLYRHARDKKDIFRSGSGDVPSSAVQAGSRLAFQPGFAEVAAR